MDKTQIKEIDYEYTDRGGVVQFDVEGKYCVYIEVQSNGENWDFYHERIRSVETFEWFASGDNFFIGDEPHDFKEFLELIGMSEVEFKTVEKTLEELAHKSYEDWASSNPEYFY